MVKRIAVSGAIAASVLIGHPAALLNVSVASVVPALMGCLEDECEDARQGCRDRGLKPRNCEGSQGAFSSECQCECVASSGSSPQT